MKKTVATLTVTVEHIIERLGPRAGLDPDGIGLLHEAKNLATMLYAARGVVLTRSAFVDLVDRTARLDVHAKAYVSARRLVRVAERLPHSMRPTEDARAQMQEAIAGPGKVTLVTCPKCRGCTLCQDVRLVTPAIAADYDLKNTPRRDRPTMVPPARKPKGE